MTVLDYFAIVLVVALNLGIGFYFTRRASRNTGEFILGGRNVPWWLAGISVVATGLNTNTPLVDGRKIRNDGISGQWFQWQAVISTAFSAIWLFRLWRRSGITTPIEFYAVRYRSRPASAARVGDVIVIGLLNAILWTVVGLVGFKKIALVLFGLPPEVTLFGVTLASDWLLVLGGVAIALTFATLAGVYSVLWSDLLELIVAMGCTYALFLMVFHDVGWSVGLRDKIVALGADGDRLLRMVPEIGPAMLVLFFLQPLISQGQWNGNVQRMLCLRDEREVIKTAMFSQLVNWVFRPWPFLILGLCGMFVISDAQLLATYPAIVAPNGQSIPDYEMVFPALVRHYFAPGFVGLVMGGFLVSFMGSLASNVHSSSSIIVNDLYRAFLRPGRDERHYVAAARIAMTLVTGVAVVVAATADNILSLVIVALTVNNASGLVKLLRFFWWRINGWCELLSQACGLLSVAFFFSPLGNQVVLSAGQALGQQSNDAYYALRVIFVFLSATAGLGAALLLTKPEPAEALHAFYRRVRPYGWWGPIAAANPDCRHHDSIGLLWAMFGAFLGFVFGGIFAAIGLLLALWPLSVPAIFICVVSFAFLRYGIERLHPAPSASP